MIPITSSNNPRICYTASGCLIHKGKVLLVKHKKLGIWLRPGGHCEVDELPHQTAEREFFEETGIKVKALSYGFLPQSSDSEFLPNPFASDVHWVSRENYDQRINRADPSKPNMTQLWPKGCEQHLGLSYFVTPVGSLEYTQDVEETDGIGWFSLEDLDELETKDNVRQEIKYAFSVFTTEKKF